MRIRLISAGCIGLLGLISATALSPLLQSAHASPSGHAPHGTVTIDGVTVPDIGPLPTSTPTPSTNLNYTAKIELGKQLYFDGRLSKNGAISCAFCHNPGNRIRRPAADLHWDQRRCGRTPGADGL